MTSWTNKDDEVFVETIDFLPQATSGKSVHSVDVDAASLVVGGVKPGETSFFNSLKPPKKKKEEMIPFLLDWARNTPR